MCEWAFVWVCACVRIRVCVFMCVCRRRRVCMCEYNVYIYARIRVCVGEKVNVWIWVYTLELGLPPLRISLNAPGGHFNIFRHPNSTCSVLLNGQHLVQIGPLLPEHTARRVISNWKWHNLSFFRRSGAFSTVRNRWVVCFTGHFRHDLAQIQHFRRCARHMICVCVWMVLWSKTPSLL